MKVVEYRICMPISVEEYHIGQLFMIAKHSHEESEKGEGVEVVENRPHEDPVHGKGQYTEKRIYINSKLPPWIRSLVPRIFYITEKAWNYFPYTITEYTCSFIPRFSANILTRYENNNGSSENCLDCSEEILKERVVDHIDIAMDECAPHHYKEEEDVQKFKSVKTGRGPLTEGWKEKCDPIMCSYKLVDVRFDMMYLLQGRVEDFVHKAVREILLVGHRQAFAWLDDWYGMSLEDVREYEAKMQRETNEKVNMKKARSGSSSDALAREPLEGEAGGITPPFSTPPSTTPTNSAPLSPEPDPKKLNRWFSWS